MGRWMSGARNASGFLSLGISPNRRFIVAIVKGGYWPAAPKVAESAKRKQPSP